MHLRPSGRFSQLVPVSVEELFDAAGKMSTAANIHSNGSPNGDEEASNHKVTYSLNANCICVTAGSTSKSSPIIGFPEISSFLQPDHLISVSNESVQGNMASRHVIPDNRNLTKSYSESSCLQTRKSCYS